jgi:hypothetical protein
VTKERDVNTKNVTHSSKNEGQADYYKQQDRTPPDQIQVNVEAHTTGAARGPSSLTTHQ